MGKSFVLRNGQGKTVGYIQQAGDDLRCRIHEPEERTPCSLYLLDSCGNIHKKEMNAIHHEYEWREEHMTVAGGCVAIGTRILADTGKEARRRIHTYMLVNVSVREEKGKRETVEENHVDTKRTGLAAQPRYFQRRWPPNPCCPETALDNNRKQPVC